MKLFLLLVLTFYFFEANSSILQIPFQKKNINYTHLLCLQNRGLLDDFFITGELQSTETFKFFITSVDFQQLGTYSFLPHFNISLVDLEFYMSPEVTASFYAATLQDYPVKMLWFDIANTRPIITCEQLWILIERMSAMSGYKVGIIGNKNDWVKKFGSETSCSKFSVYPLFYSGDKQFEDFGGWSAFQFRKGEYYDNTCGISYRQVISVQARSLRYDF